MKISVHLDTTSPADAAALAKLLGATGTGAGTTVEGSQPPTAGAVVAPAVMPGVMPTTAAAPAQAPVSVMPTGTAPAGMTRDELIAKMGAAVKIIGPAALMQRLQTKISGFTDVPSAPPELYPSISAELDLIAAGQ